MQHIDHNLKQIKRRIMRRVWYSYAISLFESRFAWVGVFIGSSVTLFVQLVSVPNIILNLFEVKLGAVPQYVWSVVANAVIDGELLKVVSLLMICLSLLYLFALLRQTRWSPPQNYIQSV